MKEDIKFKNILGLISLITFVLLTGVIIVDNFCNIKCINIIFEISTLLLSGIFGSAATLVIAKIFDYKTKKHELLNDFFFESFRYMNLIRILSIIEKGYYNDRTLEAYMDVHKNKNLYINMCQINNKLKFSKKDKKTKEVITKILQFYKDVSKNVSVICLYIRCGYATDEHMVLIEQYSKKLFIEKDTNDRIEYWNIVEEELVPLMQNLEQIVCNVTTIQKNIICNAIKFKKNKN